MEKWEKEKETHPLSSSSQGSHPAGTNTHTKEENTVIINHKIAASTI